MKFITNAILENTQVVTRPIFQMDEVEKMYDDVMANLDKELSIPKDVMDSFKIKGDLNPEIWTDDKLNPKVKKALLKLAKDFFAHLELPSNMKLKDVLFLGSLANYNWSKFSDIDLHLVVDFSNLPEEPEQAKTRFDAQKNLWNLKHDITIFGYPAELYVQDIKEKVHASAVYSIPHDKWIVKPQKESLKIDRGIIKRRVEKLFNKLRDIQADYKLEKMDTVVSKADRLKEEIKKMRKAGLEAGGEYSTENLVFKVLRRTDFMDILDAYKTKAYDKTVTVNEDQP